MRTDPPLDVAAAIFVAGLFCFVLGIVETAELARAAGASTIAAIDTQNAAGLLDLPMHPPQLGGPGLYDGVDPRAVPPGDGEDPSDTPPPVFFGEELDDDGDSILFVIDRSGSMGARADVHVPGVGTFEGTRMGKAYTELKRSIDGLPESMRFDVFVYDCMVTPMWGALLEATPANKARAKAWLRHAPRGGTGTGPALHTALSTFRGCTSVVLLTDGGPNCIGIVVGSTTGVVSTRSGTPDQHREMVRMANTQGATINVFGIGATGEGFRAFLQGLASDSGGSYFDVP